jgi:hypothetical protein
LLLGILLVVVSPFLLIQPAVLKFFSGQGDIGNSVGGITGPFVGLIGAILVYLSFEQQIEANQTQRKALRNEIIQNQIKSEYETLDKHLAEIKDEFYKLKYRRGLLAIQLNHPNKGSILEGGDAMEAYSQDIKNYGDEIYLDTIEFEYGVRYFFMLINTFHEQLTMSIVPQQQKFYLAKKFLYFYESKIKWQMQLLDRQKLGSEENSGLFSRIHQEALAIMKKTEDMYKFYLVEPIIR